MIESSNGYSAIIPKNMAEWVKEHIKSGNHAVVDDYVKRLQEMKPNMKAKNGAKMKAPASPVMAADATNVAVIEPNDVYRPDLMRPDNTMKDVGWLGVQRSPKGRTVTEFSIGTPVNGVEMDIPTLVPGLSKQEVDYVLARADRDENIGRDSIGNSVYRKAVQHAERRVAEGKSPFYSSVEEGSRPVMQADATRTTFVKPIYGEAAKKPIGKTKSVTERIDILPLNPFGLGLIMAKKNKK